MRNGKLKVPVISKLLSRLRLKKTNSSSEGETTGAQDQRDWSDDLSLTIKSLQESHQSKSYERVHAITLSNFREALGPLWDAYEDKILLIAETTIDRMLGREQTSIRQDADTWLLILPDLSASEAQAFVDSVAVTIGDKLIGARFDETDDSDPTPDTGLVDLTNALNDDGSLNKAVLRRAVAEARAVIAAQIGREKRKQALQKNRADTPLQTSHEVQGSSTQTVRAEQGLKITYTPAWSADSQAIDSFYCRPIGADGGNPFARDDPSLITANAIAFARACAVALNIMIKESVRAKLIVSIPFQVLLSPAQHQILKSFMRLEESHRFLYLRPEIVEVPHSASATDLLNARDFLTPIGRDTCILMSLTDLNRAALSIDRIMLGCHVPDDSNLSQNDLYTALENLQKIAGKRPTYALGLPDRQSLRKAVELGFMEVNSSDLQPILKKRPTATTPLLKDEVMQFV